MEERGQGRFRKEITLLDMTLVGIGAIIGSGWLFAAGLVASIAGPAGWISWVIGGIALLLRGRGAWYATHTTRTALWSAI
jgi:amino acid transporter